MVVLKLRMLVLKLLRAEVAQGRMPTVAIVPRLDVLEQTGAGRRSTGVTLRGALAL